MQLLSHFSFYKLLNVFLRISGIGSKFLIFTLLSKYLTDIEFGNYSLITSIITMMIFILGVDFYNFSIREILTQKDSFIIQNNILSTLVLYLFIYSLFFLIGFFVFNLVDFTKEYVLLVLFLCITEHLSQEIYRLLIGFNKILLANILLFSRTFVWSVYIGFLAYSGEIVSIDFILQVWLISDSVTILIPAILYLKYLRLKEFKINYKWIFNGLKISSLFFISTIFLKLIEYANRFIVDLFLGKEIAGIYTFYSSIAILITVYVNTIVISFELPSILKASDLDQQKLLFTKFKKSLLVQTVVVSIILLLLIYPILTWQDKSNFKEYLPILFFMIIGVGLMNYSLYYHFKLYVKKFDKKLVKTLVISGVASLIIAFILTKFLGVYGAAIAFTLSGGILFLNRFIEVKRLNI
ncbi:oligosaccharide flippase family protein [uncultured Tenacibaculum sp.]|uniref:lipopolysaccharide biosynthesis protein n=1 Tax=uncultured Tenacibaculum sp. TaxID=174713 RepID=UPI002612678C|nr:oligosaccharide flippase family protein [uncultured Tenacibaculum sp.]